HVATNEGILITAGAKMGQMQAFADTTTVQLPIFSADSSIDWTSRFPSATEIPDLAFLQRNYPEIGALHVFGFGLHEYDWDCHPSLEIFHHEPHINDGINSVSWSTQLRLGQSLQVKGTLLRTNGQEGFLRLIGPGGVADSIAVKSNSDKRFRLQTTPRDTGRYVYNIEFISKGKKHFREPVAVSVVAPLPVRLLVFENAPSFETKYLKRWLAGNKNSLALRTQISQDRYRSEFWNMSEIPVARISDSLLERFDLVVIDGETLTRLTRRETAILQKAVTERGLGLFLAADQTLVAGAEQSGQPGFHNVRLTAFPNLEYRLVKLRFGSLPDTETTPIQVAPFKIQYEPGLKSLIRDDTGRVVAAAFRRGRGWIGTSRIR
ncbi:hypothetical protein MJD09_16420, partial [bacterium]|nr:hypothetical protein [bacterium]